MPRLSDVLFLFTNLAAPCPQQERPTGGSAFVPEQKTHAVGDSLFGSIVTDNTWILYFQDADVRIAHFAATLLIGRNNAWRFAHKTLFNLG